MISKLCFKVLELIISVFSHSYLYSNDRVECNDIDYSQAVNCATLFTYNLMFVKLFVVQRSKVHRLLSCAICIDLYFR